ncbi:MAG TPA: AAA family ATPase [Candidatus Dormibacteraeota bacterium]|nr:AAA family ATPase [Candidatus Dormibacteraeota bacterium]
MTQTAGLILRLPEPSLVVLVGAAGAGKSTLAARLFPAEAILSSDAFRRIVSGDEADQRATKVAFAILHREVDRRLALGRTTVVDATSVTPYARRGLLRRAAAHRVPAIALVLDLAPELVLARNQLRPGHVVPEPAVRRQLADLRASTRNGALHAEGFAVVHAVRTASDLDLLSIELVRNPSGG